MNGPTKTYELELPVIVRYEADSNAAARHIAGGLTSTVVRQVERSVDGSRSHVGGFVLVEVQPDGSGRHVRYRSRERRFEPFREALGAVVSGGLLATGVIHNNWPLIVGGTLLALDSFSRYLARLVAGHVVAAVRKGDR